MERQGLSVREIMQIFGICRRTAYSRIADGTIPSLRLKNKIIVPRAAVNRMLAEPMSRGDAAEARNDPAA